MQTPERSQTAGAPFVGIDVSKARLDIAVRPSGEACSHATDEPGIAALVARLEPLAPDLVALEATGGLERAAVAALALAGLPGAVVHPRPVRDCATAIGRLAKTDAWDAAGDRRTSRTRGAPRRARCPTRRASRWPPWSSGAATWWGG